jgi:hypothetical protein
MTKKYIPDHDIVLSAPAFITKRGRVPIPCGAITFSDGSTYFEHYRHGVMTPDHSVCTQLAHTWEMSFSLRDWRRFKRTLIGTYNQVSVKVQSIEDPCTIEYKEALVTITNTPSFIEEAVHVEVLIVVDNPTLT